MHAYTNASDSIEFLVLRTLGEHVHNQCVRASVLEGTFSSYLQAEKLRAEVDYERPHDFAYDYLVTSLLSKWKGWSTEVKLDQVALESWTAFETKCKETNVRLSNLRLEGKDPSVLGFISEVQRKISLVLGSYRSFQAFERNRWSNGATTLTRRGATVQQKMSVPVAVSPSALKHLKTDIEHDPIWASSILGVRPSGPFSLLKSNFEIVPYNRWLTVPKNAKTDRCIAAEPAGNSFLQQGVGRYIRSRLKRFGVDLDDQSNNQRAAALAAVRELATLDLKGASDTVSRELVWLLLPVKWAELLDDLRSTHSRFPDGRVVRLEKFSSMGNAYTFELESLIFWAIATTSCGVTSTSDEAEVSTQILIYGDDIIVPKKHAATTIEWLEYFGFTINRDKSFVEGHFYESCGIHVFKGVDVTPAYQKEIVSPSGQIIPSELVRFANRLIRWQTKHEDFLTEDQYIALSECVTQILFMYPGRHIPMIPYSESDDGVIVPGPLLPGKYCPNRHSYMCTVLRYQPKAVSDDVLIVSPTGEIRSSSLSYFALKLRDPSFSYTDPKGHVVRIAGGGWIQYKTWVHA